MSLVKKFVVAIFAVFYLAISSGFTVHLHYCMGKLANLDLFQGNKNKCGICGMHKKNAKGCCKDEHKVVKFTHDQKSDDNTVIKIKQLTKLLPSVVVVEYSSVLSQTEYKERYNLPPPHFRSTPVFIRNCNFRI